MKMNTPVTQVEQTMQEGQILVSVTDTKGSITFCNEDFIRISGFKKNELLGKNHNIVRHPDMPPEAFADLWATNKAGRPWTGIVKNRCKNGDYYWVQANITPITENGQVSGYMSVRTKPSTAQIQQAERLYQDIRSGRANLQPGGL
ncbi:MAG TPA: PAS domain S-box protein, partial [Gammaproteobacteria bacterium]|nr:PAS domain S-box protein [Gammaproteobacteria bacterium]